MFPHIMNNFTFPLQPKQDTDSDLDTGCLPDLSQTPFTIAQPYIPLAPLDPNAWQGANNIFNAWQYPDTVHPIRYASELVESPVQTAQWSNLPDLSHYRRAHSLTHTPSSASIASLASSEFISSDGDPLHGLAVQSDPFNNQRTIDLSRQSSFSSIASMNFNPVQLPTTLNPAWISPQKSMPSLQDNAGPWTARRPSQSLGHARNDSLSSLLSLDDNVGCPATTSSRLHNQDVWSTPSVISHGVRKMSLHHRRTSSKLSNYSTIKHLSSRPSLNRNARSYSLSAMRRESRESSRAVSTSPPGQAEVRDRLQIIANEVSSIPVASQQDKAKTRWVRDWLKLCYKRESGSTVPRQGLYHSYTLSCNDFGLDPINAASFGKAVRATFKDIHTRRLGERGNSKYHFVDLQPLLPIEAARLNHYGDSSGRKHTAPGQGISEADETACSDEEEEESGDEDEEMAESVDDFFDSSHTSNIRSHCPSAPRHHTVSVMRSAISQNSPINPTTEQVEFPSVEDFTAAAAPQDGLVVRGFWQALSAHLTELLARFHDLQLDDVNEATCRFWTTLDPVVIQLIHVGEMGECVARALSIYFDRVVEQLVAHLPLGLSLDQATSLLNLTDMLTPVITAALQQYPVEFREHCEAITTRTAYLFRCIIDLNQASLALAQDRSLSNPAKLDDLVASWSYLDKESIKDQCGLLGCGGRSTISNILGGFEHLLETVRDRNLNEGDALQDLGVWMEQWLQCLALDVKDLLKLATRTVFITSQVMKFFVLKGDACCRPYSLLKTWIDGFVCVWVQRKIGLSLGDTENYSGLSVTVPPLRFGQYTTDVATAVPHPRLQPTSNFSNNGVPLSQNQFCHNLSLLS